MLCQRRLSGTVVPQNRHEIPRFDVQRHAIYRDGTGFLVSFLIYLDVFVFQIFRFYNIHFYRILFVDWPITSSAS